MVQVFLDTETTGVETGACVVELAAILMEDGQIIDTFHQYAKPYRPMHPQAVTITGITNKFLSQFPEEKIMLQEFREWMMGVPVQQCLAYNAHFDVRIINDRMKMDHIIETNFFDDYEIIDVAKIVKSAIKSGKIKTTGNSWKLENVTNYFNYKYSAHNALEDTKAMLYVYNEVIKW